MPRTRRPSSRYSRFIRLLLEYLVVFLINAASATLASFHVLNVMPWIVAGLTIFTGLLTAVAAAAFNMLLIRQFWAISGRKDSHHNRPVAIGIAFLGFVALIGAYAGLYLIEMPQVFKDAANSTSIHQIVGAVYFSAATISTLGYGDLAPVGDIARITAAIEAINGLIAFGVFTGAIATFMAGATSVVAGTASEKQAGSEGNHNNRG